MASIDVAQEPSAVPTARAESYDVVVIGAGLAGLTAGALLAHAGKGVLVVEADELPGGYAHALHHGDYTFDRADHLITSCAFDGPFGQGVVDAVLREPFCCSPLGGAGRGRRRAASDAAAGKRRELRVATM